MSLSLRQKQDFYYELGQRLHTGIGFSQAVKQLSEDTSGAVRRFARGLIAAAAAGDTVSEAFARQRSVVTPLEVSIFSGSERSGRLEYACQYLAAYFGAMAESRSTIIKGSLYPLFQLHCAVFVGPIKDLIVGGGAHAYFHKVGVFFLYFYGAALLLVILVRTAVDAATVFPGIDRLLRFVPLFGKIRRAFSLGRFCATYEMQLQSGINVMNSLTQAAKASQSAIVVAAVRRIIPKVTAGEQVSPLMTQTGAFTKKMVRAIKLGEDTGKLDEELRLLAANFQKEAMSRIAVLSAWLPKILYLGIAVYVGYVIVTVYSATLSNSMKVLESIVPYWH